MGQPKKIVLAEAKARRKKLLREFKSLCKADPKTTKAEFARINGLSRARICQLFKQAEAE